MPAERGQRRERRADREPRTRLRHEGRIVRAVELTEEGDEIVTLVRVRCDDPAVIECAAK